MIKRLTIGALLLAVLGLFAGACGSDDKADETTTTKKDTTTTEADGQDEDTDDSSEVEDVSDDEFDAAVGEISATVEGANGDICVLMEVLSTGTIGLPNPSTPAQVKTATDFVAQVLNAVADAAPAESASDAEAIRAAANQVEADAEANDYDPEWMNSPDYSPLGSDEAMTALYNFSEAATAACGTGETTETTVG